MVAIEERIRTNRPSLEERLSQAGAGLVPNVSLEWPEPPYSDEPSPYAEPWDDR